MPQNITISFFNPDPTSGTTPPGPTTNVGYFVAHNDTDQSITRGWKFTLPIAEGAILPGDHLWTDAGEYVQWEPLETQEGTINYHADGITPRVLVCWAKAQVNARQRRILQVEKDNARSAPAFIVHPNVAADVGDLIEDQRLESYSGSWNIVRVLRNSSPVSFKAVPKQHVPGPVVHRILVQVTQNDYTMHDWIEVWSDLPYMDAEHWIPLSTVESASLGEIVNSNKFQIRNCEASVLMQSVKMEAESAFDYGAQNMIAKEGEFICEGQPLQNMAVRYMFYDPTEPPSGAEEQLFIHLRQWKDGSGAAHAMGGGWDTHSAYGPCGRVGDVAPWMTAQQKIDAAITVARGYYNSDAHPFGGERNAHFRSKLQGNANPGATGDNGTFGQFVFPSMVGSEVPLLLSGLYQAALQEACRPVFLLRDNGTYPPFENHPLAGIWRGIPFQGNDCSPPYSFGGMDTIGAEGNGKRADEFCGTPPTRPAFDDRWAGFDEQHFSLNSLCMTFLMTGSRFIGKLIDHYRNNMVMHLRRSSFGVTFPNQVVGKVFAPRGEGRSLSSCAWIEWVSPNQEFRNEINNHVSDMLDINSTAAGTTLSNISLFGVDYSDTIVPSRAIKSYKTTNNDSRILNGQAQLMWEDGMFAQCLDWSAVCASSSIQTAIENIIKPVAFSQVDECWFQSPQEGNSYEVFKALRFNGGNLPTGDLPPAQTFDLQSGLHDTLGLDGDFLVLRDGGKFWNLNLVLYAYQQAVADVVPATQAKAAAILNQHRAAWAQGPAGGGFYNEESTLNYGRWAMVPGLSLDPFTHTFT